MTNDLPNLPEQKDNKISNPDVAQSNKIIYITIALIIVLAAALILTNTGILNLSGKVVTDTNATTSDLSIRTSPVLGNASAPITIYEFSDFSCPYCAAADNENSQAISYLKSINSNWQAPLPNIIKTYVETGKAKLVFKYYPGHGQGKAAHIVSLALANQSSALFWKFHDLAFANQADTGDIVKMKALAESLGANTTQIESYIASGVYETQLNDDIAMAKSNGVKGTPSFIINGNLIAGAQSYSTFKQVIDSELKRV
jgi:protein-disulfide isomerase